MHPRTHEIAAITIALAAISGWQFTKFVGGYGLFYHLSPAHGGWVLGGCTLVAYVAALYSLLRDKE